MPKIDLKSLEGKKMRHPHLAEAKGQVGDMKLERISIELPAHAARRIKATAKLRGLTIKQFVIQAMNAQYPNLFNVRYPDF